MKQNKNGFKSPICKDKSRLGCNSKPPTLSPRSIRKLSSSFCDIDASQVTDEALNKKKRRAAPGGYVPSKQSDKDINDDVDGADED